MSEGDIVRDPMAKIPLGSTIIQINQYRDETDKGLIIQLKIETPDKKRYWISPVQALNANDFVVNRLIVQKAE